MNVKFGLKHTQNSDKLLENELTETNLGDFPK